ncbi:MAG: ATP-binding cassette domain-containing protein, partial [Clostridia bacterium]|nr:ATP-binding cassette domain-containing protein [Clostridia bacterium]
MGDGSIYGLIGSNGSGKSTLMRILSGIYQPDAGSIFYDGEPVWENTAVKQQIVYLSDDPYFLPHCTM